MKPNNQKKGNPIAGGVILIIAFTLILLLVLVVNGDVLLGKAEDYYSVSNGAGVNNSKNTYVSLDVNAVFGNYAETKHTVNFIPVGKDQHFIVWLDNDDVISLTVKNKKMIKKLNDISEQTWAYYSYGTSLTPPDSVTIKGKITTMDPKIEGFYKDALNQIGISQSDFNIYYLTIDATTTPFTVVLYILFCVVFIIAGIAVIAGEKKQRRKVKEAQAQAAMAGGAYGMPPQNQMPAGMPPQNQMMGNMNPQDTTYGTQSNYNGVNQDLLK